MSEKKSPLRIDVLWTISPRSALTLSVVHDAKVRLYFHITAVPLSLLTCTVRLGSPNHPFRTVIHVHIKYGSDLPPSELLALSLTPLFCFFFFVAAP